MYFQKLAQWENMKASLEGSVSDGVCYKGFKPFNPKEIHHHLGLYIFYELSQLPQVYMKFNPH